MVQVASSTVFGSVAGRISLYSRLLLHTVAWAATTLANVLLRGRAHPLNWTVEQSLNVMLLKCLFTHGSYVHWRNFMHLWLSTHPEEGEGLVETRVPAGTFGGPRTRDSFWFELKPSARTQQQLPAPKASCVLVFLHGGGWLAGDPRMYRPAFRLWMQQLAAQGVAMRVLSVGYSLAPESPFPAAIHDVAAAWTWLHEQLRAEGSRECVVLGGDSAGGNLVVTSLAHMRDEGMLRGALPAAAMLISPAVDFTRSSVFGADLERFLLQQAQQQQKQTQQAQQQQKQTQQAQQQQAQAQTQGEEFAHDYVTLSEGCAVAELYVRATSAAQMADPLVSPTMLPSFAGLVQQRLLVVWGGVEAMAADIAAFVRKVGGSGEVKVVAHEEPSEPHVYCVLTMRHLLEKGARVIVPFIADTALACAGGGRGPAGGGSK